MPAINALCRRARGDDRRVQALAGGQLSVIFRSAETGTRGHTICGVQSPFSSSTPPPCASRAILPCRSRSRATQCRASASSRSTTTTAASTRPPTARVAEVAFRQHALSQTACATRQDEAAASTIDASLDRAVRAAARVRRPARRAAPTCCCCCAAPRRSARPPAARRCCRRRWCRRLRHGARGARAAAARAPRHQRPRRRRDEVTPHLLHGLGLGEEDSSRVVAEAVQGRGVFAADRRGVEAALAAHVRRAQRGNGRRAIRRHPPRVAAAVAARRPAARDERRPF